MVHAATGATISEAAGQTWEANVNMSPGDTSIQVCKIFLLSTSSSTTDNGGKMVINSGKTVEMVIDDGYNDASVIEILSGATLHLYGTMTGNFDELKIANKEAEATSRDGHFYIHLYEGAIFKPTYNSDNYIEPVLGVGGVKSNKFECYGCNVGSNLEDRETYPDVSFNKTSDIPVTSNVAVAIGTNTVTNDVTDTYVGRFSLDDPGPIYTITAADKAGFSQVVWTKGPKGDVIETDTDLDHAEDPYVVVNGNVVNIHLKEHARYPAYATYIPDPVWTWNSEHTEATLTTYSYDKEYADDPYGIKGTPHVTNNITGPVYNPDTGKDEYTAAVTLPGEETPRTDTIEIPHDSGGSGDDNGGGSGDDNGGGNGGGSGDDAQNTVVYYFTDDSVWTWTKGSTSGMPVTLKNKNAAEDSQTFGKLDKVSVDGTVIYQKGAVSADDKFEATPGSISSCGSTCKPSTWANIS